MHMHHDADQHGEDCGCGGNEGQQNDCGCGCDHGMIEKEPQPECGCGHNH